MIARGRSGLILAKDSLGTTVPPGRFAVPDTSFRRRCTGRSPRAGEERNCPDFGVGDRHRPAGLSRTPSPRRSRWAACKVEKRQIQTPRGAVRTRRSTEPTADSGSASQTASKFWSDVPNHVGPPEGGMPTLASATLRPAIKWQFGLAFPKPWESIGDSGSRIADRPRRKIAGPGLQALTCNFRWSV